MFLGLFMGMKAPSPTPEQTTALIQLAKVLSNPIRVSMLIYLSKSMAMCSSFPRMLKNVSQPQASKNLKIFLQHGLATKQLIGKTWIYQLNQEKWDLIKPLFDIDSV